MIVGQVTSEREAVVPVAVRGPDGQHETVDAAIDTGFNGFLTLSSDVIARLALVQLGVTRAALGDGTEAELSVFEGIVLWGGREQNVLVLGAEGGALLGMSMLWGYRVTFEVEDGGAVMVESMA